MDNPDDNLAMAGGIPGGDDQPVQGGPPAQPEDADNVDQFYDDGGETFLPADHVSQTTAKWHM